MIWTGAWQRPHNYGDAPAEAVNVHDGGRRDRCVHARQAARAGPDAAAFLERLYPNRFADLPSGRVRYGVLSTDAGRIMDDGTIGRLGEDQFYVTTTSTGADAVIEWFEWWNAVWGMDVEIVNLTGALAAVNVAGPRSRELLAPLTDVDTSNEGSRTSTPGKCLSPACLACSCASGSSASSATSCTSRARTANTCGTPCSRTAPPRAAVRARAAAHPAAREAARHRRPGHRLRIERPRGGHAVDRQARQGRLRRQVGTGARPGARLPRAAGRLRDDGGVVPVEGGRSCSAGNPPRPRHQRPLEPVPWAAHREWPGCGQSWHTRAPRYGDQSQRRCCESARVRLKPFFDPEGSG